MQAGLFAKKVGMTQIFDESGNILPVTILNAGVCQVSQIKTTNTDGYDAVQVAYEEKKLENINKSIRGHLKKVSDRGFKSFGEFRVKTPEDFKLGQILKVDIFSVGQKN
jgi:large subunit ribosomal protein L3